MSEQAPAPPPASRFLRWVMPGFAFKAVIIGGGYATGRELAEFFLPAGPLGGLLAMLLAGMIWSGVAAVTFLFAYRFGTRDYRTFFKALTGPAWPVFELAYAAMILLLLSIFGATASSIGAATFGWPPVAGALLLIVGILAVVAFGNRSVEQLFKWVTVLLYGVYAMFVTLSFWRFGGRIGTALATYPVPVNWWQGGLAYASYNIIGAVLVLPTLRHATRDRDAIIAGLLCGPLAMAPALLFFLAMVGFYPGIGAQTLPSDFLLGQLGLPIFHLLFQVMIFAALLESASGGLHAINERIAQAMKGGGRTMTLGLRTAVAATILVVATFFAQRYGLVALIARGYLASAYVFFVLYIMPLLTIGVWRLRQRGAGPRGAVGHGALTAATSRSASARTVRGRPGSA